LATARGEGAYYATAREFFSTQSLAMKRSFIYGSGPDDAIEGRARTQTLAIQLVVSLKTGRTIHGTNGMTGQCSTLGDCKKQKAG
jgi:hypothetical protein